MRRWTQSRDGRIETGGIDDDGATWSLSYPSRGSDPAWDEDAEQPYDNWRSYHTRDGWATMLLKHDGCIEIATAANVPFFVDGRRLTDEERDRTNHDCDDFIHICDARAYLALIQSVVPLTDAWENRRR